MGGQGLFRRKGVLQIQFAPSPSSLLRFSYGNELQPKARNAQQLLSVLRTGVFWRREALPLGI